MKTVQPYFLTILIAVLVLNDFSQAYAAPPMEQQSIGDCVQYALQNEPRTSFIQPTNINDAHLLEHKRLATGKMLEGSIAAGNAMLKSPLDPSALAEFAAALQQMDDAMKNAIDEMYQRARAPCSEAGRQYQKTVIRYLSQFPLHAACRSIVWRFPTIAGVNMMLACLAPVNNSVVLLGREMAELEVKLLDPCTGEPGNLPPNEPPEVLPDDVLYQLIDFLPGVGTSAQIIESLTGIDAETGRHLQDWERVIGIVPQTIPAKRSFGIAQGTESIWKYIKQIEKAGVYPKSLVPQQFTIHTGIKDFFVSKGGSKHLWEDVAKRIQNKSIHPYQRSFYDQANLYQFRETLRKLEQTDIKYTPRSVIDNREDATPYFNYIDNWEIGVAKGKGGPLDEIYHAQRTGSFPLLFLSSNTNYAHSVRSSPLLTESLNHKNVSVADITARESTLEISGGPSDIEIDPTTGRIFIANSISNTLAIIDNQTITTIGPLDLRPEGIALYPNQNTVYVAHPFNDTIAVINTISNTLISRILVDSGPAVLAVNATNDRMYVTQEYNGTISVVDMLQNKVIAEIPVGGLPTDVAINPVNGNIYVTNLISNTVSVIDAISNTLVSTVTVGLSPFSLAVHPATGNVYVANVADDTISVIEGATNTIVATIDIANPVAVAVNSSSNYIYVLSRSTEKLLIIDGASNNVIGSRWSGNRPSKIAVNTSNGQVYITSDWNNTVRVLFSPDDPGPIGDYGSYLPLVTR